MKRTTTLTTLLLIAALPLGALAATPAEPSPTGTPSHAAPAKPDASSADKSAPPMFKELDKNHDGYVSKAEAKRSAEVMSQFKNVDANNDGKLSVQEWLKARIS